MCKCAKRAIGLLQSLGYSRGWQRTEHKEGMGTWIRLQGCFRNEHGREFSANYVRNHHAKTAILALYWYCVDFLKGI